MLEHGGTVKERTTRGYQAVQGTNGRKPATRTRLQLASFRVAVAEPAQCLSGKDRCGKTDSYAVGVEADHKR